MHTKYSETLIKVIVWSVISGKGTGRLKIVERMVNQHSYKDNLKKKLLSQIEDYFIDTDIFMQESAPSHTAATVTKFPKDKRKILYQNGPVIRQIFVLLRRICESY